MKRVRELSPRAIGGVGPQVVGVRRSELPDIDAEWDRLLSVVAKTGPTQQFDDLRPQIVISKPVRDRHGHVPLHQHMTSWKHVYAKGSRPRHPFCLGAELLEIHDMFEDLVRNDHIHRFVVEGPTAVGPCHAHVDRRTGPFPNGCFVLKPVLGGVEAGGATRKLIVHLRDQAAVPASDVEDRWRCRWALRKFERKNVEDLLMVA